MYSLATQDTKNCATNRRTCITIMYQCTVSLNNVCVFFGYVQHKLKPSQASKVRQFVSITGTDESTATNCLSQSNWRLDLATDNFYQDPIRYLVEPPRAAVDRRKLDSLFNKYRSESSSKHFSYLSPAL